MDPPATHPLPPLAVSEPRAALTGPEPVEPPGPSEGEAFLRALLSLTPHAFVTPCLVAVNVLVYVAMVASGVSFFNPEAAAVLPWGATFGPKVGQGEWWRLWASNYLHFGIIHLLFNLWVLGSAGPLVERLFGNVGFLLLYTFAGLLGSLASIFWHPLVVGAGASGAIFGVYGALLAFLVRRRGSIPAEVLKSLQQSTVAFVGYNLFFGLLAQGIDVAAHLGGLAGGFLAGLILSRPLTPEARARRFVRELAAGLAGALVVVGGAMAFTAVRAPDDPLAALEEVGEVEKRVLPLYQNALQQASEGKLREPEVADLIEREVLPPWRQARARLGSLRGVPSAAQPLLADIREYMQDREESWELLVQAIREDDQAKATRSEEKWKAAEEVARRMQEKQAKNR